MPCDSSHCAPSGREEESQRVCELLVYVLDAKNLPVPKEVRTAANTIYGNPVELDRDTARLCELCRDMTKSEQTKLIYDGRNPLARKLADWWEAHQVEDERKSLAEKEKERRKTLRKSARSKLTAEEIQAMEDIGPI